MIFKLRRILFRYAFSAFEKILQNSHDFIFLSSISRCGCKWLFESAQGKVCFINTNAVLSTFEYSEQPDWNTVNIGEIREFHSRNNKFFYVDISRPTEFSEEQYLIKMDMHVACFLEVEECTVISANHKS